MSWTITKSNAKTTFFQAVAATPQTRLAHDGEKMNCIQLSCVELWGQTWGRGWMTKASGVGERRKGRGELRRDCHHRVAALFVPTRMQQWYIDIWYITMIYIWGRGQGGPFAGKITWCPWGAPEYVLKQEDSSELTLAFVIMTIIANNDKM